MPNQSNEQWEERSVMSDGKTEVPIDNSPYGKLKSLLGAMNFGAAMPWLDELVESERLKAREEERERVDKLIGEIIQSSHHPEQAWYDALRCVRASLTKDSEK